jgi:ABC-type multidrug transport system fused ATPase/permease subunit
MGCFRVLALASPAERALLRRAILCKLAEGLLAIGPLLVAYLTAAALLGDPRAAAWLPGAADSGMRMLGITALLVLCGAGQLLFCYLANAQGYAAGYRLAADLRSRLVAHLRRLPMSVLDRREPGGLAHVLMQDVRAIEMIPGTVLPRFVAALALPAAMLALACALDWRMALLLGMGLLLALPALLLGQRGLRHATKAQAGALAALNARLIEFVRGIVVIKAFGLTGQRRTHVAGAAAGFRDTAKALTASFVRPMIAVPSLLGLGPILVMIIGSQLAGAGALPAADWLFLCLIGLRLVACLSEVLDSSAMALQANDALDRIEAVLAEPAARIAQPALALPSTGEIVFEQVTFDYRAVPANARLAEVGPGSDPAAVPALRKVDLRLPARGMVALVGRSGAGKSTVVRLLQRHWQPQSGRITIGGVDLQAWPEAALRQMVGIVAQRTLLFTLPVCENIRLGRPDAGDAEVVAAAKAARCHDLILRLPEGYDTVLANGGAMLSGGERQRLALARTILQRSPIIILDEATTALDVENERLVQAALDDLMRDRLVLVIAHRLWTVRRADQILVLEAGRIVEGGRHVELIAAGGAYHSLWQDLAEAPGWRGSAGHADDARYGATARIPALVGADLMRA